MGFSGLEHQDQAHRVRGRLSNLPCAAFRGCENLLPVSGTVTAHNSAVNITATNYSKDEKKAGWVVAHPLRHNRSADIDCLKASSLESPRALPTRRRRR